MTRRVGCRHPPDHVVIKYSIDDLPDLLELSYRECLDCGEWLSMGAANDDSEAVKLEIGAAEIAANDGPIRTCDNAMPEDCEECGWDCWPWPDALMTPAEFSGYLARCIVTHEREAG